MTPATPADNSSTNQPGAYRDAPIAPEDRVPPKTKLAFGTGALTMAWAELGSLINPIFVVQFGISPALISLAQVIYRLSDGFCDLIVGSTSDNTRTRWGRRRPFLFVGAILTGLWMPVTWMFNPDWGQHAIYGWMIGCFLVFYLFHSVFNVPWQSLLLEMTPDTNERTNVAAWRGYLQKIGAILPGWLWFFTQLPVFHHSGRVPSILFGARWVTLAVGLMVVASGLIPALFVKERFYKAASHQAKVTISQNIKYTFGNRPFVILIIFTLFFLLGTYGKGSLGFFTMLCYVCDGDTHLAAQIGGLAGTINLLIGLAGIPAFQFLARHYGKRRALAVAMWLTLSSSVSTLLFYTPRHPYLSILSDTLLAPAGTGMWILIPSMQGDVADQDELHTGERREGAFASVYSWMYKLAISLATGLAGPLVVWAGYSSQLATQSAGTLLAMRVLLAVVPTVCLLAALFVLHHYPLDRTRIIEIRRMLEARRGKM